MEYLNGVEDDNRISNLRWCTPSENQHNSKKRKKLATSKYKGVCFIRRTKRWKSYGSFAGRCKHLGYFKSEELAAKTYDEYVRKLYGEFAKCNFSEV